MLLGSFSLSNLGVWTPRTTNSLGCFSSNLTRSGKRCRQLIQHSVQNSRTTILPRRSLSLIGLSEPMVPTAPSNSGALMRSGSWACVRGRPPRVRLTQRERTTARTRRRIPLDAQRVNMKAPHGVANHAGGLVVGVPKPPGRYIDTVPGMRQRCKFARRIRALRGRRTICRLRRLAGRLRIEEIAELIAVLFQDQI